MQKLLFIILFFVSVNAFAQENKKIDSLFYLLDTAKTSAANRMWSINSEKNSIYKNYTIECSCLRYGGKPTFFYNIEGKDNGIFLDKKKLNTIKLTSIRTLIVTSKRIDTTDRRDYAIFLIEPNRGGYMMHEVDFINPTTHITSLPDVIIAKPDNSAFEIKGLIQANSKDLAKYYNKSVITMGSIVNRIVDNNMVLLIMGADYPNQDFTIMIRGENNINKFEPDFLLKGKNRLVKVTGKVFEYKGKPTIEISNENQIQQVRRK
ncbi:hypothetical protein [Mucilaginibacter sp. SG564]|uniref:hypothetical protein n=1 Tax=unclassified Mucilaginibacter TaxID=2617802 RepID=UPI001556D6B0|nr:hypothetical protein [Mucilaginibacter sp. SG564]NOW97428.1 hypothetical protein [Mucilaginibacter sp. SG564]